MLVLIGGYGTPFALPIIKYQMPLHLFYRFGYRVSIIGIINRIGGIGPKIFYLPALAV